MTGTNSGPLNMELPAISPERSELLGGMTFIDGTNAGWGAWELTGWIDDYLVTPKRMPRPALVYETGVGSVALDPRSPSARTATLGSGELHRLVAAARKRVVDSLRAFIAAPSDDRFLNAALFANRVARDKVDGQVVWVARPSEGDRLSDIVLSLFAADVLMHREFHEQSLCVCEVCGRVSFAPVLVTRSGCREHPHRSSSASGFHRRPSDPDLF